MLGSGSGSHGESSQEAVGSGQFDVLGGRQQEHAARCPMSRECEASTHAAMGSNRPGSSPACACRTLNASSTLRSSHSASMPQATLTAAEKFSGRSRDIRPWATGNASATTISKWGSRGRSVGYGQAGEARTGTPTWGFAFCRTVLGPGKARDHRCTSRRRQPGRVIGLVAPPR